MASNQGEINEVLLKAYLVKCFRLGTKLDNAPKELEIIKELEFGPSIKCPEWKNEYEKLLNDKNYKKLKEIFSKAKSSFKADLRINGINYSVKCTIGANPAIVNHTARNGFISVCERINISIKQLDEIIDAYWKLRVSGIIKEDVSNENKNSPFANNKKYLKPIIEYFLFKGTGRGNSDFPADKVLSFVDPFNPATYKILNTKDAVDSMWDCLVFSIRSKGMPPKLDPISKHKDLMPWVKNANGRLKGSLHIRSKS